MEFNFSIGQKVRVKPYDEIPENVRNKGLSKHAGSVGEIVDVMFSSAKGCYVYRILFDGFSLPSKTDFPEGALWLLAKKEQPTYTYEFTYGDNIVIARLYEVTSDSKTEIGRGHGHIFHDGAVGIAQAASYALKRIYHDLEDDAE
jgi:hypothetical protein